MKYCKDCKWFRDFVLQASLGKCANPIGNANNSDYLVSGDRRLRTSDMEFASSMRKYGPCGQQAKLFEPKAPSLLKRLWTRIPK